MDAGAHEILMSTAETLFAEEGIEAISLRRINREAGQKNHSAVHYHFGNKLSLLDSIVEQRAPEMAAEFRQYRESLHTDTPTIDQLVDCLLIPLADLLESDRHPYALMRFRMVVSRDPDVRQIIAKHAPVDGRAELASMFEPALAHLSEAEVMQRLHHARLLCGGIVSTLSAAMTPDGVAAAFRAEIPALRTELVALMSAPAPNPS